MTFGRRVPTIVHESLTVDAELEAPTMSGHRSRQSPVRPGGGRLVARLSVAALVVILGAGCVATGEAPATGDAPGSVETLAIDAVAADPMAAEGDDAAGAGTAALSASAEGSRNPADLLVGGEFAPIVDPGDFVRVVDNHYLPLTPGLTLIYESERERVEVSVTFHTRVIAGVTTVVVIDRSFVEGALVEETEEWFAQDRWGNVWYFGEQALDSAERPHDDSPDAWRAGVNGAQPGIVMLAEPRAGDVYRQEFLRGSAEDLARVVSSGHRIEVPYGSFSEVLMTEDWTPLEPDVLETKLYAPGVGLVLGQQVLGGEDSLQLIEVRSS
jgi:hypothetical protein